MTQGQKHAANAPTEITVQVIDVRGRAQFPVAGPGNPAMDRLPGGAQAVAGGGGGEVFESLSSISGEDLKQGISSICKAVTQALETVSPDSCSVELNIGFKASAKVPVLMSGETNAALKVTLNWKKTSPDKQTG